MKKLPIGIQTLSKIINEGYYYVDKTAFVKKLENGGYYFFSRPRRFGKSLFLDTLKEAFSGNKKLFKGLYLCDKWDWNKKYPVVVIDLSIVSTDNQENLIKSLNSKLNSIAQRYSITLTEELIQLRFEELIQRLYQKYKQKVVVLVDEYDKPILDVIEDTQKAKNNREILKKFFEILKPADPYLHLVFLTGVSRFSKVSIFSGLNQLNDITMDKEFATVCGYTQKELEIVFADRLQNFEKEEVKRWFNGYSWLGEPVYNPFDILLLFDKKEFRAYWFETGTPTFLTKVFQKNSYYLPELENLEVGEDILSNLDVENIYLENLLFQAGYLTIKDSYMLSGKKYYLLTYPNFEVKTSFNDSLLKYLISPPQASKTQLALIKAFLSEDIEIIKEVLYSFFSSIPAEWFRKNYIQEYEGFYASVIYALFNGSGLFTITEDATNKGKIDLTVIIKEKVYIIEFKVVEEAKEGNALQQIKDKRYYEKYTGQYDKIFLIGIVFSKKKRNIINFEVEKYNVKYNQGI